MLQADEGFTAVVLLWRSGGAASCSGVALGGTCGSCSPQLAVHCSLICCCCVGVLVISSMECGQLLYLRVL